MPTFVYKAPGGTTEVLMIQSKQSRFSLDHGDVFQSRLNINLNVSAKPSSQSHTVRRSFTF